MRVHGFKLGFTGPAQRPQYWTHGATAAGEIALRHSFKGDTLSIFQDPRTLVKAAMKT